MYMIPWYKNPVESAFFVFGRDTDKYPTISENVVFSFRIKVSDDLMEQVESHVYTLIYNFVHIFC